jgi:hypothetical protein
MIDRHYKELVKPEAARAWFDVRPPAGRKYIPFPQKLATN